MENTKSSYQHLDKNECMLLNIAEIIHKKFNSNVCIYLHAALDFCKSPEDGIRGAAIFLVLALLNLVDTSRSSSGYSNFEEVLSQAFNDRSHQVRLKTAKGFSLLSKIHRELEI